MDRKLVTTARDRRNRACNDRHRFGGREKNTVPGSPTPRSRLGQTVPYIAARPRRFSSYGRTMTGYFQMINEGWRHQRPQDQPDLAGIMPSARRRRSNRPEKLVEDDGVLADVGTVGTHAQRRYPEIPQRRPRCRTSSSRRAGGVSPIRKIFPWSVPMYPGLRDGGQDVRAIHCEEQARR